MLNVVKDVDSFHIEVPLKNSVAKLMSFLEYRSAKKFKAGYSSKSGMLKVTGEDTLVTVPIIGKPYILHTRKGVKTWFVNADYFILCRHTSAQTEADNFIKVMGDGEVVVAQYGTYRSAYISDAPMYIKDDALIAYSPLHEDSGYKVVKIQGWFKICIPCEIIYRA